MEKEYKLILDSEYEKDIKEMLKKINPKIEDNISTEDMICLIFCDGFYHFKKRFDRGYYD